MKLNEYLNCYKSVDFDIPDNKIDYVVVICWEKDRTGSYAKDFPYMTKFTDKLLSMAEIDYCMRNGCPVAKFSDIIENNKNLFLRFAKKNWQDAYYEAVINDDVELCYQFIKEFDNVCGGRYGETINKEYFELLNKCK